MVVDCSDGETGETHATAVARGAGDGLSLDSPAGTGRNHALGPVWGNGTGAVPAVYAPLLRHLASYGFVVAAADTPFSGTGKEMLVTTTVPIEPGPLGSVPALHGPVLFLGGQFDAIVSPALLVIPRYQAASQVPAVYGELAGATHFTPAGDGGGFRGAITAWFRYWLMGDARAYGVFFGPGCTLCADPAWSKVLRNAKALDV